MEDVDWNHLRSFLATADAGSLSAAARRLGLAQSTLSRQIVAVEQMLGATLFERVGRSMVLTDTGLALLEHARAMGAAADELVLTASGRATDVDGVVSVSAGDTVAAYLLPPMVARLRQRVPGLTVQIVTTNALSDLRLREADIAIRHLRPDQPDLIGRLVREATADFYASVEWVRAHGHPRRLADLKAQSFVGVDRSGDYLRYLQALGMNLGRDPFSCYAENLVTSWTLVQAGMGIGPTMREIADCTPGVVRVLDDEASIRFPIWLVTHRELRTSRRIRVAFDFLAEALAGTQAPES